MRPEVTYNLSTVVEDLGTKVGTLEISIAQERAIKNAYIARNAELEKEIEVLNSDLQVAELNARTEDD